MKAKKYKYRGFTFEVEDGIMNMIEPDYYDGQELEGSKPTELEFRDVIADWIDVRNRDLTEMPLDAFEIEPIRKGFSVEEIIAIFGYDIVSYYDNLNKK